MAESLVIFAIAAAGSLVRWSADLALRRFAIREARETAGTFSKLACSGMSVGTVDPVLRVGFILACYGAIVLVLVSALPGELALERTGFAFALLCAGGLVGEISGGRVTPQATEPETDAAPPTADRPGRTSRRLSLALALTLNVSIALLTAGRGLIPIVTLSEGAGYTDRLEPVIVVARRNHDPLEDAPVSDRAGL
jgi:hypothetical protein